MTARRILASLLCLCDAALFIGSTLLLRNAMEVSRFYTPGAPQWEMARYWFAGVIGAGMYVLLGYATRIYAVRVPLPPTRVPLITGINCLVIFCVMLYASWHYVNYFDAGQLISHRTFLYALAGTYVLSTLLHIGASTLLSLSPPARS